MTFSVPEKFRIRAGRQLPEENLPQVINITVDEWPAIRSAINRAVRLCQPDEDAAD